MSLWGASTSDESKPKNLTTAEKKQVFANASGWVLEAGSALSGNDNTSATPEVLVASGGLAGATDTTGLRAPTVTSMRFVKGTTATTDLTAANSTARVRVEITWDEEITVAGTPQVVLANSNASGGGHGTYTLSYISAGSTANRKLFQATSQSLGNTDVLTLGGTNIALNSGTISDTVRGGTAQAASLVLSGLSAVAVTIAS